MRTVPQFLLSWDYFLKCQQCSLAGRKIITLLCAERRTDIDMRPTLHTRQLIMSLWQNKQELWRDYMITSQGLIGAVGSVATDQLVQVVLDPR